MTIVIVPVPTTSTKKRFVDAESVTVKVTPTLCEGEQLVFSHSRGTSYDNAGGGGASLLGNGGSAGRNDGDAGCDGGVGAGGGGGKPKDAKFANYYANGGEGGCAGFMLIF